MLDGMIPWSLFVLLALPSVPVAHAAAPSPAASALAETGASTSAETADATDQAAAESPPFLYPRLMLAGGLLLGPHAIGNEECRTELARCETKGSFFGFGGTIEVRGRLWRPLYLHVRGLAVRNVSPNDPIYSGMLGAGGGLGLYHRRVFGRAEYLYVNARGDNRFEPPFFQGKVASDEWGNHAGSLSVGFRQPLPHNLAVELWGGVMFGPKSLRLVPQQEPDERVLTSFQLGLNLAWDVWR